MYAEDLAWVHHTSFGDLARQAAGVLLGALRRAGIDRGLVVDLGCGSGILAAELTDAGYDVLGVDASAAMLRLAMQQAPSARLVHASLLEVAIPPCVAVTAVGEAFNYAGISLPEIFGRIHRSLTPGGVLLFDVAGPGRLGHGRRSRLANHEDPDGAWLLTLRAEETLDTADMAFGHAAGMAFGHAAGMAFGHAAGMAFGHAAGMAFGHAAGMAFGHGAGLTRRITLFRRIGDTYRRSDETHTLTLYRPGEVVERLAGAGLEVRRVRGYGTFRFGPGWTGFVAQRSATG